MPLFIRIKDSIIPIHNSKTCEENGVRTIHVSPWKLLGQCATRIIFGHFKDETTIEKCETLEAVKREIKSYMMYYNHYRGQWHLKSCRLQNTDSSFNKLPSFFKMSFTKGTVYILALASLFTLTHIAP